MRHLFLLMISLVIGIHLKSQQPEPVYSFGRVSKPISFYQQQAKAWKKVLTENPKDTLAWYYYYYASRNLAFHDTTDKRSSKEKFDAIQQLIDDMGKQIPESYEYNLCKWMAGGFDLTLLPYLKKAAAKGNGRTEHLDFMVNIGEIERDAAAKFKYEKMKYEAGLISTGMMNYNYNVIKGLEPNAIIVACGDNDTYPIWALQALGYRKDITVLNLSLILIDDYREKIFKELGIDNIKINWEGDADTTKVSYLKFQEIILQRIANNKKKLKLYVPLTLAGKESYTASISDNLYLTGLTYVYSIASLDNIAMIKRNFEQNYSLDYFEHNFYKDISEELVKEINRNYIVPMLKLYDHYKLSGDIQKQEWIKGKLMQVSKDTEEEKEVMTHLNSK